MSLQYTSNNLVGFNIHLAAVVSLGHNFQLSCDFFYVLLCIPCAIDYMQIQTSPTQFAPLLDLVLAG